MIPHLVHARPPGQHDDRLASLMIDMAAPPTLLATLFRALADPTRLSCLLALRDGPRTVGEVIAATGVGQPTLSKHLAYLRDCGLVQAERSGRFVTYCLCWTGVEELLRAADALLARAGANITACPGNRGA